MLPVHKAIQELRREVTPQQPRKPTVDAATQIQGLCEQARRPDLAGPYIKEGISPDQARARLMELMVQREQMRESRQATPKHEDVYQRLNASARH